jgi:hypothetical protein
LRGIFASNFTNCKNVAIDLFHLTDTVGVDINSANESATCFERTCETRSHDVADQGETAIGSYNHFNDNFDCQTVTTRTSWPDETQWGTDMP